LRKHLQGLLFQNTFSVAYFLKNKHFLQHGALKMFSQSLTQSSGQPKNFYVRVVFSDKSGKMYGDLQPLLLPFGGLNKINK
jgi:hypothetical protein